MVQLNLIISRLRKISFFLFLVPSIALFLSILAANILVTFKFDVDTFYSNNLPLSINCNAKNDFCAYVDPTAFHYINKLKRIDLNKAPLDTCGKKLKYYILIDNQKLRFIEYKKKYFLKTKINNKFIDKDINYFVDISDKEEERCIKYSKHYNVYKIFPFPYELVRKIKYNSSYTAATSIAIFPLIDGDTSISNLVKRFPINLIFKPLLYLTSILMLFYWVTYQKAFDKITGQKKMSKFFIFGSASSIFLFFHVLLLGSEFDADWFKKLRKLIIVSFILCELIAQTFLVRRIYLIKNLLHNYTFRSIIISKIIFVITIILITIIILAILSVMNLPQKVDYILEWNYFLVLLIFYLLSSIMWKKNN